MWEMLLSKEPAPPEVAYCFAFFGLFMLIYFAYWSYRKLIVETEDPDPKL